MCFGMKGLSHEVFCFSSKSAVSQEEENENSYYQYVRHPTCILNELDTNDVKPIMLQQEWI